MNNEIIKNIPWMTKEGYADLTKIPVEPTLRQAISKNEEEFSSACRMLISLCGYERKEAIVLVFGLLEYYTDDIQQKEQI